MAESDRSIGAMARAVLTLRTAARGLIDGPEGRFVIPRILRTGVFDPEAPSETVDMDTMADLCRIAVSGLEGAMSPAEAAIDQARLAALDMAEEVARTAVLVDETDVRCQIGDLIYAIRSGSDGGPRPTWNRIAQRFLIIGESLEEMTRLAKAIDEEDDPEGSDSATIELGRLMAGWILAKDLRKIDVNDPDGVREIEG